ncbi:hypothetical protein HOD20_02900, partial [archaeon]|nr:hypothetical protein [archaeon]
MVYIYKKIISGKPYYYLRMSKKINNKSVTKDIAYLGNDPQKIEKKLESIEKIYKKEIRKAYRNIKKFITSEYILNKIKEQKIKSNVYLEKNLLEEIESVKYHFNNYFLKENELTIREIYNNYLIEFAYNTTSIEGNTINLQEAVKLLNENITPKNKTLREIYDLQNTKKVFFNLLEKKKNINHKSIIEIHDNLLENIDNRTGYRFHDVRVFRSKFNTTPGKYVKSDMDILLNWYKKIKKELHPFVLASIFHQKFEKVHPFSDGNGRTGRMLVNIILMNHNYPPIIVRKKKRVDYLSSLSEGDNISLTKMDNKSFYKIIHFLGDELIIN